MMDAERTLAKEFAQDKVFNKRTLGDDEKTAMSKDRALAICKKKVEIVTEEALSNCVNDLMTTGDTKVEKVAAQESEEEQEEAAADAVAPDLELGKTEPNDTVYDSQSVIIWKKNSTP